MPKNWLYLNDFSGGLNSVKDPRDLNLNELSKITNMMVDKQGMLRTVGGMVSHGLINTTVATLVGGYGCAMLESDYETEPKSITAISDIDFTGTFNYLSMITVVPGTSWAGGVLTLTTDVNHGLLEGYEVKLANFTNYDGDYTILSVPSPTTLTVAYGSDEGSQTGLTRVIWDTIFPAGTEIKITGSTNNNGFYTVLYTQVVNTRLYVDGDFTTEFNTSATILSLPKEEILVLLSDADNNNVDTYSKNNDVWTPAQINIDPTGGNLNESSKIVHYSIDGAIRTSDANFDNGSRIRWFGYIKRSHFVGDPDSPTSAAHHFFNFYEKDNKLTPPTYGVIHGSNYPTKNVGFNITLTHTFNDQSFWENTEYQIAFSFIYDGNQESLLYIPDPAETFTPDEGDSVTIVVRAQQGSATDDTDSYDPRISGGRIYARKNGSDDAWVLLTDIDMRQGARNTLNGSYKDWATVSATTTSTGSIESLSPNLDTYESLNGYSHEVVSNSMGKDAEQWKFGLVANRKAFVFNVRRYSETTGQNETYADRIYYSLTNRFDTFLPDNYIDVVRGDAESYVMGIEYADRLLCFKQNSVQIVNISSPADTDWFVESTHKFMGVRNPAAVTRTEFGIVWINDSGCYFYNGSKIVNLTGDEVNGIPSKIDDDEWDDFIGITTAHQSIIGYERHKKQLIVMKDCTGNEGDSGDAYLYDFKTGSWMPLINAFTDGVVYSNFIYDWNGDLIVAYESNGNVVFSKWDSDETSVKSDILFHTKDIDFGHPGVIKKIYKVVITYKSAQGQSAPLVYGLDGHTTIATAFPGSFSVKTEWEVAVFTPATPVSCQSIRLKVYNNENADMMDINEIAIQWRLLPHKTVS